MSNQIELRHIKYFLAIADSLHFRKAADKLYISQPGLSRQIKQMEDELGFKLFERNNKKVELTVAGEYLKTELSQTIINLSQIFERAKLLNNGVLGELKFGYVGSAIQNVIPNLLLKFRKEHGNIHFDLSEMDNHQQVEALLNREIDLGFVRLDKVPYPLKLKQIFKDTFSLVLPKSHHLNKGNFKNVNQLKDEEFILFEPSYSPSYFETVNQIFSASGFRPKISHNTVHAGTIFRLVENKFGISIVPTSLSLGYKLNVKFIELKQIPQRTTLSVVWNCSNRNPVLKLMLDEISKA